MAVLQLWTMTAKIWKRDEILLFILHLLHSKGSYSMRFSQAKCATTLLHDVFTEALGPSDNFKYSCILHRKMPLWSYFFIFLSLWKMERLLQISLITYACFNVISLTNCMPLFFLIYDLFELWWLRDKASSTHASRRLSFYATLFKQSCSLFTLPQWNPYVIGIPKLFICNVVLTGFVGQ